MVTPNYQSNKVSIILCTYNNANTIKSCINSVLNQSHINFKFIIINDASTDSTDKIITQFYDPRIFYVKCNKNSGSIGKIRQYSLKYATNEYVFTIDGDCIADKKWIENGLKYIIEKKCDAIEGKIIYNNSHYSPTLTDRVVENLNGSVWMTANMGFNRDIFSTITFDSSFKALEDRELALHLLMLNKKIMFVKNCIVTHQKTYRTIKSYLSEINRIESKIKLIKKYGDRTDHIWKIYKPEFLLVAIFPPIIFIEFFLGRIRSWNDLKLLPFVWVKAVYMRYIIWKTAIKQGVFVI